MNTESYLTLTEAAKLAPGRPHPSAVWRWARKGLAVRGSDRRVHLAHVRAGGRIFIKPEDLDSFFRAVAEADAAHFEQPQPVPVLPRSRSAKQRAKDIEAANRELAAMGV